MTRREDAQGRTFLPWKFRIQEGNQKTGPEDADAKSRCEVYPDPKNRTFLRHAFTPGNSRIPDQGDKMSTMTRRNGPPEKETGRRQDSEVTSKVIRIAVGCCANVASVVDNPLGNLWRN